MERQSLVGRLIGGSYCHCSPYSLRITGGVIQWRSSSFSPTSRHFHNLVSQMKHSTPLNSINVLVPPVGPPSASTNFDFAVPSKEAVELWRSANAVCFDVDSTVCLDEGIDELAEYCSAGKAVAEWTARAMGGSVPFEEALAARLNIFKPSLKQVEAFLQERPPKISPGIVELVNKLKSRNVDVYLVSGGFRQMINPVGGILGIAEENIFANRLLFDSTGEFSGFDEKEPTSRSGGKATAVQRIRTDGKYKTMIMVGDGATDLEARQPGGADMFVCYAACQLRQTVASKADWVVFTFSELIDSF